MSLIVACIENNRTLLSRNRSFRALSVPLSVVTPQELI